LALASRADLSPQRVRAHGADSRRAARRGNRRHWPPSWRRCRACAPYSALGSPSARVDSDDGRGWLGPGKGVARHAPPFASHRRRRMRRAFASQPSRDWRIWTWPLIRRRRSRSLLHPARPRARAGATSTAATDAGAHRGAHRSPGPATFTLRLFRSAVGLATTCHRHAAQLGTIW